MTSAFYIEPETNRSASSIFEAAAQGNKLIIKKWVQSGKSSDFNQVKSFYKKKTDAYLVDR